MEFTARGPSPWEMTVPGETVKPDRLAIAGWLWDRLRAAGKPVPLGQLVNDARAAGLWPTTPAGEKGPKLTTFYKAKRWVAVAHHGWHVAEIEAPGFGDKRQRLWSIASGADPDHEIDYEAVCRSQDLQRIVEADLGPPTKGRRWPCPILQGERPNFEVKDNRWTCFSCGAYGDVIDYVARRDGTTRREAALKLDPSVSRRGVRPSTPAVAPAPSRPPDPPAPAPERASEPVGRGKAPAWQDPEWQGTIDLIVGRAEAALWSAEGRAALGWLRARGLDDSTIRRFRLGFLAAPVRSDPVEALGTDREGKPRGVWAPRGVVIPWVHPDAWYSVADGDPGPRWVGCNVRRLAEGDPSGPLPAKWDKYQALAGSERGHAYPWPDAPAVGTPALICEGEFDALVGWQEAGWVLNVATFGGGGPEQLAPRRPRVPGRLPDWLLLYDQDEAGDNAARSMIRRAPHRCRRLRLPPGVNDLTHLHKGGAPVLGWLRGEYERFGWPWPLRS